MILTESRIGDARFDLVRRLRLPAVLVPGPRRVRRLRLPAVLVPGPRRVRRLRLPAVLVPGPRRKAQGGRDRILLQGDVPSPIKQPSGCRFHTRCWKATQVCKTAEPPLVSLAPGHEAACHHPENAPDQQPEDSTPAAG